MISAESKNIKNGKPLTDAELQSIGQRVLSGRLVIMKRPPWSCAYCGPTIRNLRYVGDISEVSEWEGRCESCGTIFTS